MKQLNVIIAMLIWGSMGLFVKGISLTSGQLALARGVIGVSFLLLIIPLLKVNLSWDAIKKNGLLLILSGGAIGINWILLFEAYNYTTVSMATVSYYFAPVIVTLLAPWVLKERLTVKKFSCVAVAMVGLILIIFDQGANFAGGALEYKGILFGLAAACFYASIVLMNKFIKGLSGVEVTIIQLFCSSVVLIPYVAMTSSFSVGTLPWSEIVQILILGVVHTGVAYYLYFSAITSLEGQRVAILSYIDPVSAIVFSTIILNETMTGMQVVGGLLILGATLISSIEPRDGNANLKEAEA